MAGESAKSAGHGQADSPIDELIQEILNEPGGSPKSASGGSSPASLLETAFASALVSPKTSQLERVFIAEAFGTALAEALAPALAEQLTPKVMKHLDEVMAAKPADKNSNSGRKSGNRESHQSGR